MKKYEENMKKYMRNRKIRTLPIYGPWDLEIISSSSSYFAAGVGGGSQFLGLGEKT